MSSRMWSSLSWAILLTACQSIGSQNDRPAVYISHTDESFAELQTTVNTAIGTEVGLASDALTGSSTLTIERVQRGTMQNRLPQGRIIEMPFQFRLMSGSGGCYLVDRSTDNRYPLQAASCRPE